MTSRRWLKASTLRRTWSQLLFRRSTTLLRGSHSLSMKMKTPEYAKRQHQRHPIRESRSFSRKWALASSKEERHKSARRATNSSCLSKTRSQSSLFSRTYGLPIWAHSQSCLRRPMIRILQHCALKASHTQLRSAATSTWKMREMHLWLHWASSHRSETIPGLRTRTSLWSGRSLSLPLSKAIISVRVGISS